jgi:hypothetical protein
MNWFSNVITSAITAIVMILFSQLHFKYAHALMEFWISVTVFCLIAGIIRFLKFEFDEMFNVNKDL